MKRRKTATAPKIYRDVIHKFNGPEEVIKKCNKIFYKISNSEQDEIINFAKVGDNINEIEKGLTYGTPELMEKYLQCKNAISINTNTPMEVTSRDVTGLYFNVSDVISGEPDHWYNTTMIKENKFMKIEVNISAPSTTTQNEIFKKFIEMVNIIDELESKGTRVEVWLINKSETGKSNQFKGVSDIRVLFKNYNEILDLQPLIFWACSGAFLRYCIFLLRFDTLNFNNGVRDYSIDALSFGRYTGGENEPATNLTGDTLYIQSIYKDNLTGKINLTNLHY